MVDQTSTAYQFGEMIGMLLGSLAITYLLTRLVRWVYRKSHDDRARSFRAFWIVLAFTLMMNIFGIGPGLKLWLVLYTPCLVLWLILDLRSAKGSEAVQQFQPGTHRETQRPTRQPIQR